MSCDLWLIVHYKKERMIHTCLAYASASYAQYDNYILLTKDESFHFNLEVGLSARSDL